jgi:hypothetical protein
VKGLRHCGRKTCVSGSVRRALHHGTPVKYSYGSVYRGEEVEGEGRDSDGQMMRVCGVESSSFDMLAVYADDRGN